MVDFAKIRAENKAKLEAQKNEPTKISAPSAEDTSSDDEVSPRELAKIRLVTLLDDAILNEWEQGFCTSVLNFLNRYPSQNMSAKQEAVLEKTWKKYQDSISPDPTPKGNPPAQFAKQQSPQHTKPQNYFDDLEDDIPF